MVPLLIPARGEAERRHDVPDDGGVADLLQGASHDDALAQTFKGLCVDLIYRQESRDPGLHGPTPVSLANLGVARLFKLAIAVEAI